MRDLRRTATVGTSSCLSTAVMAATVAAPNLKHPLTSPKRTRPARSNSLQRMLELEKQCMVSFFPDP